MFHGQIVQIATLQISGLENKKCSPCEIFGITYHQTLRLLSRRGPRVPDVRLSQHYLGQKKVFCHFSNFCRKKFPGLTKNPCTFLYNFEDCNLQKSRKKNLHSFNKQVSVKCRKFKAAHFTPHWFLLSSVKFWSYNLKRQHLLVTRISAVRSIKI